MKNKEEIKAIQKVIKFLRKGYGKKNCTADYYGCPNCMAQWVIGWLESHIDLLKMNE